MYPEVRPYSRYLVNTVTELMDSTHSEGFLRQGVPLDNTERGCTKVLTPEDCSGWGDKTSSSVERQKNNIVRVWLVCQMGKEGKWG